MIDGCIEALLLFFHADPVNRSWFPREERRGPCTKQVVIFKVLEVNIYPANYISSILLILKHRYGSTSQLIYITMCTHDLYIMSYFVLGKHCGKSLMHNRKSNHLKNKSLWYTTFDQMKMIPVHGIYLGLIRKIWFEKR